MGLFDRITCEVDLPDGWSPPACAEFQTKDLGQTLTNYKIAADGTLWREVFDVENDGPPGPHPIFKNWLDHQPTKRVNVRWVPDDYTGKLNFYDYERLDEDRIQSHRYQALFIRGRLDLLTVGEDDG